MDILGEQILNLDTVDILRQMTLLVALPCALWGTEQHPWPLHSRCQDTPAVTATHAPDIAKCPLEGQTPTAENTALGDSF